MAKTSRARAAPAPPSTRADRIASTLDCFRRVIRALRVSARYAEAKSGLRPAQLFVLGQIAAAPNQSISEIAARTMTDRTSVAGMVDRLASRGLVARVRGAADRRRVEVRLTAAGQRTLARAPSSPTQFLLEGLEQLDDATLGRLTSDVGKLVRAMGAEAGPAAMLFEDGAREPPRAAARRLRASPRRP